MKNFNLNQIVDEILFWKWDPLQVNDVPSCRDEYSSYSDQITEMLLAKRSVDDIEKMLTDIRYNKMHCDPDPKRLILDNEIAEMLIYFATEIGIQ